jgi:type IV secretion system protein VirB11
MPYALSVFGDDWPDPKVEDFFVVGPGHYFVRRDGETLKREAPELDALAVEAIGALAAHLRGQYSDEGWPILDGELPTGERINMTLPPCVPHPSLAIRRMGANDPTLDGLDAYGLWDLIKNKEGGTRGNVHAGRLTEAKALIAAGEVNEAIKRFVEWRWCIGFVGETSAGKTWDMRAVARAIPLHERIGTVGDADELKRLPHENRVNFLFSEHGPVQAEDLIKNALRNTLRWLLVQEVRGKEAFAFLRGLITSPGITSWHARSCETAFPALEFMARQHEACRSVESDTLRDMMRNLIDVVIHVERQPGGKFRATDIRFGREL